MGDSFLFHIDVTLLGTVETTHHIEKACLSCPIGSDDGQDLTLFHFHHDIVEGLKLAKGDADVLGPKQDFSFFGIGIGQRRFFSIHSRSSVNP